MTTLEEVKRRLMDAMALEEQYAERWLEIAEHKLQTERAREHPFRRMYDVSTVGARMLTAREVCGMSRAQAAIRMSVSRSLLGLWERGQANMPAERLRTVCLVLGVSAKWLLEGGDEGGPPIPTVQLRKRITQNWKQRADLLQARAKARKELRALNGAYRARKRQGTVS